MSPSWLGPRPAGAVLGSPFPLLLEPQFLYLSQERREEGEFADPHLDMVLRRLMHDNVGVGVLLPLLCLERQMSCTPESRAQSSGT